MSLKRAQGSLNFLQLYTIYKKSTLLGNPKKLYCTIRQKYNRFFEKLTATQFRKDDLMLLLTRIIPLCTPPCHPLRAVSFSSILHSVTTKVYRRVRTWCCCPLEPEPSSYWLQRAKINNSDSLLLFYTFTKGGIPLTS